MEGQKSASQCESGAVLAQAQDEKSDATAASDSVANGVVVGSRESAPTTAGAVATSVVAASNDNTAAPTLTALTGRLSVPLPIPIATDLVRKPKAAYGIDGIGTICKNLLGQQHRKAEEAVQAIVSREFVMLSSEQSLHRLQSALVDTDQVMATLVDNLARMELVMSAASKPRGENKRSGWVALKKPKPEQPAQSVVASASILPATSSASTSSAAVNSFVFKPVGIQQPLCRLFQKNECSNAACPHLHVVEKDTTRQKKTNTEIIANPVELAKSLAGIPYILYSLAVGEESQFSLLRRTLDQLPEAHRTLNVRHALVMWSLSRPADRMKLIMRPSCRILHFPNFTNLTHKHRFQAWRRIQSDHIEEWKKANAQKPIPSHLQSNCFDFYPLTLQLPHDHAKLLDVHRSLGGTVHPSLDAASSAIASASTVASSSSASATAASPPSQVRSKKKEMRLSPTSEEDTDMSLSPVPPKESCPLFLHFPIPNYLANYPLHTTSPYCASDSQLGSMQKPIWIMKPYSRGSGHGIIVTDLANHVKSEWLNEEYVVSRYIERPLLVDKQHIKQPHEILPASADGPALPDLRKFDLRLYCFILPYDFPPHSAASSSSTFPFAVYLSTDGLARFATHTYDSKSIDSANLGTKMDAFSHLTNNAINVANDFRREKSKGCWENCDLAALQQYFAQQREKSLSSSSTPTTEATSPYKWDWAYVWNQIRRLVVHSLCISDDYLRTGMDPSNRFSFELLGFDVIIDSEFRVHLCEINSMPDLNSSPPNSQYHQTYPVDHKVKSQMLADLFNVLQLRRTTEEEIQLAERPIKPFTMPSSINQQSTTYERDSNLNLGGFERLI